jgi:hypothetical protein
MPSPANPEQESYVLPGVVGKWNLDIKACEGIDAINFLEFQVEEISGQLIGFVAQGTPPNLSNIRVLQSPSIDIEGNIKFVVDDPTPFTFTGKFTDTDGNPVLNGSVSGCPGIGDTIADDGTWVATAQTG